MFSACPFFSSWRDAFQILHLFFLFLQTSWGRYPRAGITIFCGVDGDHASRLQSFLSTLIPWVMHRVFQTGLLCSCFTRLGGIPADICILMKHFTLSDKHRKALLDRYPFAAWRSDCYSGTLDICNGRSADFPKGSEFPAVIQISTISTIVSQSCATAQRRNI